MAEEEPNVPLGEPADDAVPESEEAEAAAPPPPPPKPANPRILLTGGITFVGQHILKELLNSNKYIVRVPVTHPCKQLERWSPNSHPIEIVVTDMWKTASWGPLVAGCTYIIHSTRPSTNVTDSEYIGQYVKGTMELLKAAKEVGTVKRVVFVSSLSAVTGPSLKCINKTYTEEDWPDMDTLPLKCRGKVSVEIEAWKYVRSFPDGKCFQLTVVNPGCVMGPLLSKLVAPGRIELHRQLMEHNVKRVPKVYLPIVDVRDVATAIVNALTAVGAANKRHLLSAENIWYTQTAQILADEFTRYGYDVPTKRASSMYLWFNSMFDSRCRKWRSVVNKEFKLDNTRMQTVLGVKPRSINTTIIDMGYSMIDTGLVKKPINYTARASF